MFPSLGRLAVGARLKYLAPDLGDLVDRISAPFAAALRAASTSHVARASLPAARQLARINARCAAPAAPAP